MIRLDTPSASTLHMTLISCNLALAAVIASAITVLCLVLCLPVLRRQIGYLALELIVVSVVWPIRVSRPGRDR